MRTEFALYFLTYLPFLLVSGLFWDDWVFFYQSSRTPILWELGRPYMEAFFAFGEFFTYPVSASRFAIFGLWGATSYLLSLLASRYLDLIRPHRFMLFIIISVCPLNPARLHNTIIHYFSCQFLFIFAWYLISTRPESILKKIAILISLFFSYTTNSFLVLHYYFCFLYLFRKKNEKYIPLFQKPWNFLVALLPIVFFVLNKLFFPPFGTYANYNKIDLYQIFPSLLQTAWVGLKALSFPFLINNFSLTEFWVVLLVVFALTYKLYSKANWKIGKKKALLAITLGFLGLFASLFPYLLVGAVPTPAGWDSRHFMCAMMFVPILFFLFFSQIQTRLVAKVGLPLMLSFFVAKSFTTYSIALLDSVVQDVTIELFRSNNSIHKADVIILDERQRPFLSVGRLSNFYEISNFLEKAFGDGKRFGINSAAGGHSTNIVDWVPLVEKYRSDKLSYGNYNLPKNGELHFVSVGYKSDLNTHTTLLAWKYVFWRIFDRESYLEELKEHIKLDIQWKEVQS